MAVQVTLDWQEHLIAALVGVLRSVESQRRNYVRRRGPQATTDRTNDHPDLTHIEAAGAEMAVAKYRGRYWHGGVNEFNGPDIKPNIEVKHTAYPNGCLIVGLNAPDDRPFILVRGTIPDYEIVGWLYGHEAKQPEFKKNMHGEGEVYKVPAESLHELGARKED